MRRSGLVVVLLCGVAFAQPKNKSTELFEQGRDLAKAGKYTEACAKFDESYALEAAPGTALNYGDCLEKMGERRRAWHMYSAAARAFQKDNDSRATYARDRANHVGGKLASITIKVANPALPGLTIKLGSDSVAPAAQIEDRFEPGAITITASAPGKRDFSTSADGLAGSSVIVEIPAELGAGAVGAFVEPPAEAGRRDRTRVKIAFVTGGVGLASVITSVVVGLSAKGAYDDGLANCPVTMGRPQCMTAEQKQVLDDAGTRADIATGFAIAGGVLVGAAAVLYFTAPRESLTVTPSASPSGAGVTFSGRF